MTIVIDARPLQSAYAQRGIGTLIRNIYTRLAHSPHHARYLFCGWGNTPPLDAVRWKRLYRPPWRSWWWEQLLWPLDLARMRAQVLLAPAACGPLRGIALPAVAPCPRVAIVYDLNCLHDPACAHIARSHAFAVQLRALRSVARVVTISQFVAQDIARCAGVDARRIAVIPCGVDDTLRELAPAMGKGTERDGPPFMLGLGETANKNIAAVVQVFEQCVKRGYGGELVIVGSRERQSAEVRERVAAGGVSNRIRFTGAVETAELARLYATCDLFVFPSWCEGFGLPIIEAQYCGAPVIAANTTSLPQAAGPDVPLFAPDDIHGMAAMAHTLVTNAHVREEQVCRGRARTAPLTWDEAAGMLEGWLIDAAGG